MKTCTKCRKSKVLGDFPKRKLGKDGLSCWCRECHNSWAKDRRLKPHYPIQSRNTMYKRKYSLTYDEVVEMWEAQGESCAICGAIENLGRNNWPSVDHDHKTGQVRGLLCHDCNTLLGFAKDDPAILARAIAYLEESRLATE